MDRKIRPHGFSIFRYSPSIGSDKRDLKINGTFIEERSGRTIQNRFKYRISMRITKQVEILINEIKNKGNKY